MTNKCPPVSCPIGIEFCLSEYFGSPQGTHGRNGAMVQGIVLHCLNQSQAEYHNRQNNPEDCPPDDADGHMSMHFTIGELGIKQYLYGDDIAWGVNSYGGNFPLQLEPPYTYIGWPNLPSDYPLDYQVIHVGIAVPPAISSSGKTAKCECDETPYGLQMSQYQQLVHLVAFLVQEYEIVLSRDTVNFHELIEDLGRDCKESCPCAKDNRLICDVAEFCEVCNEDSTYAKSNDLTWFYGVNEWGCKAKVNVTDFLDAWCCNIMEKVECAINEATPIILTAAKNAAQACIDALPKLTVTQGDAFSFDPTTLTLVIPFDHPPVDASLGQQFSFDADTQTLVVPESHPPVNVIQGDTFSFDSSTQSLVLPPESDPCPINLTTDTALGCDPTLNKDNCTLNIPCIAVGRKLNLDELGQALVVPENTIVNIPMTTAVINTVPSFAQPVPGDEDEGCVRVPCDGFYDFNFQLKVKSKLDGDPQELSKDAVIAVFINRNTTTGNGDFARDYLPVVTENTFDLTAYFSRTACLTAGDYLCIQVYFEDIGNTSDQQLDLSVGAITMERICECVGAE